MDSSITSRAHWRGKGARAFDKGVSIDGHELNHGSHAILDFKLGWIVRQAEKAGLITLTAPIEEVWP